MDKFEQQKNECGKKLDENDTNVLKAIFNPLLPLSDADDEKQFTEGTDADGIVDVSQEAIDLELAGVRAAEQKKYDEALDSLTSCLNLAPRYASAYNNRAQVFRLKEDTKAALEDLEVAISYSRGRGKAGCQAFIQRALIRRLQGDDEGSAEDFKAAAALGSDFARTMVVQMNPYAAMCNKMLYEMMEKLKAGEYRDSPDDIPPTKYV